jgi:hypothetical protein
MTGKREPITPLPNTATFLMERFMCVFLLILVTWNSPINILADISFCYGSFHTICFTVKLVSYATIYIEDKGIYFYRGGRCRAKKYQTVLLLFDIVALQLELLYKYIHSSEGAAPLYAIYRQPR